MSRESAFDLFFLLAILLAPLYLGAVYLWSFSISIFVLTASFYLYWLRLQRSPDPVVIQTRLDGLIVLYLAFFIISATQTQNIYKTSVEVFKTLSMFCVFYATLYYCRERRNIQSLASGMTFLGGAISLFGILQLLGALPHYWWRREHFLSSVYVNHNHFAGILEIILPISVGLALILDQKSKKILFVFLLGLMGVAFILSLSRGGFLSMGLAFGFMLLLLVIRRAVGKAFLVIAALVLMITSVALLFGLDPILSRIATMKNIDSTDDVSMIQRILIWKGTARLIFGHFWFGTGPGTFESTFFKFRPKGFIDRPGFAHNDYLQLWADCGVFVFLSAMALFAALFYKGLRIVQKHQSMLSLGIASGCLASIAAWGVHSLVDFNFHIPANWIFFTVASGMLLSVGRPKGYTASFSRKSMQVLISASCILVLAGCIFFGISDWFLWKGMKEYKAGHADAAVVSFGKSIQINPFNPEPYFLKALILNSSGIDAVDLVQAIRIDPSEPYYDYELGKAYLKSSRPKDILNILPYFTKAIEKDPTDPRLRYLSARYLLSANRIRNKTIENEAKEMLRVSIRLNPPSALSVYEALWEYENNIEMLEDFHRSVPEGLKGFVEFLAENDLWKYHRKYYLESQGIDPDRKYQLRVSTPWNSEPIESYSLNELDAVSGEAFFQGNFVYSNGRFEKRISFKNLPYRLEIRAKGSKAGNSYPVLIVGLDGKTVDSIYIDSPGFVNFFSILQTSAGEHVLSIEYSNDYQGGSPKRDRNVWIETIRLYESLS